MSFNTSAHWMVFADRTEQPPGDDRLENAHAIILHQDVTLHELTAGATERWFLWRDGRPQPSILVRIDHHPPDASALVDNLTAGADGVLLAGCRNRADIQALDVVLGVAEALAGKPAGSIAIMAEFATTAESLLSPHSLAGASGRLQALVFDAGRLCEALGLKAITADADLTTPDAVRLARVHVVLRASEARLPVYEVLATSPDPQSLQKVLDDGFTGIIAHSIEGIRPLGGSAG